MTQHGVRSFLLPLAALLIGGGCGPTPEGTCSSLPEGAIDSFQLTIKTGGDATDADIYLCVTRD